MQAHWWLSVLAVAPLADMCGEAPQISEARKIVEPARPPPPPPAPEPTSGPAEPPPDCPKKLELPARFTGQLAGIGWISSEASEAHLTTASPGESALGPDPLPTLTVIRQAATVRVADGKRTVYPGDKQRTTAVVLDLPVPAPHDDSAAFITTACLPIDAATALRLWSYVPLTQPQPDFDALKPKVNAHVRDALRPGDRNAWERRGGVPPAGLGGFTTTIPGCPRVLAVNSNLATRLAYDFTSAVLCLADDGALIDVLPPKRNRFLKYLAVVDLDGDGVDELLVRHESHDRGQATRTSSDELLWYDPGRRLLTTHTLGHIDHGA